MRHMDETDQKILRILQDNARTSLKDMGEKTFLSSPAVSSRIAKLERSGVITGYRGLIDSEKLGYHIETFISVAVSGERKTAFYRKIEASPHVLECFGVTGRYSVLLKAVFPGKEELERFQKDMETFGKVSVQVVLSRPFENRGISVEEAPVMKGS